MATSKTTNVTTTGTTPAGYTEYETHFQTGHAAQPYVVAGTKYDTDYAPAYQYGVQLIQEHADKAYTDVVSTARTGWDKVKGGSKLTFDQAEPAIKTAFDKVIQLREEQLHVGKTETEAGAVNLKKKVTTEHKSITVPVEHEEVVIERKTVNKAAKAGDMDIESETIRVPVKAEQVRVTKEAVVTEEVSVGKKKVTDNQTVGADLKREELVVETDGKATVKHTGDTKKKS